MDRTGAPWGHRRMVLFRKTVWPFYGVMLFVLMPLSYLPEISL